MKAEILDIKNFISKLTLVKILNAIVVYKSFYLSRIIRKSVHWGMPLSVSVEVTTNCNLHCPECPSGLKKLTRPKGTLELSDFVKYIEPLEKKLMYLMLYFQGEPYLNKNLFELIKYAKSKKIYTATSTNGHFIDSENARKTVTSGLDRIIISLDGADNKAYSSYRIGGDFEKVLNGISNLVEWKKKLKSKKPYIILQFLVLKTNEHQIVEMQQLASSLDVDQLQFKPAQFYEYKTGNPLMPENTRYARYIKKADGSYTLKKKIKNQCLRMWQTLVITWDGRVLPCCFDKNAQYKLGNLNTSSLYKIWKGREYKSFRSKILKNKKSIVICTNCTE